MTRFIQLRDFLTRQQGLVPYLFLLPALLILGLTVFLPAVQAFFLSLTNYDAIGTPQWVGLSNFLRLWTDSTFWKVVGNSLLYLISVVPILVFASLCLAILVNRQLRGIRWFRLFFYTPVVISMVVAGIAWKAVYASNGLLNQFLRVLGMQQGIPWLTSPQLALWSVMLVTIWKGLGYYMAIYLAGLQSISPELYEAAALDGSQGWRKHWDITLPLMRPYIVLVGIISAISATKVFEEVYIMTQGGPLNSSKTIVYYLYEQAFQNLEIGYACTIGLILFLFVLGLSVIRLALTQFTSSDTPTL